MSSFTHLPTQWRRYGVAIALVSLMSGCSMFSSDEDDETKPAPLVDIKEEQSFDKVWSHGVGNGQGDLYYRIRPAVVGDRIYVAANNGDVEAFDRLTGKSLWDVDVDAKLTAGVGAGGGLVVLATDDGYVFGLNADSGEVLWKTAVASEVLAAPQTDGTLVAVVTVDGHLKGLDAKTGTERWRYAATAPALSLRASGAPIIANGAVIAGFANGKVIAVSEENGKPLWEARAGVPKGSSEIERLIDVGADLLVSENVLYVVTYQGVLSAFDVQSGRKMWEREASIYVSLGESFSSLYLADPKGTVTAFGKNEQGVRWEQTALARRQLSGAAAWLDFVAVGDIEGYVHLLAQSDGHFVAREKVDGDGVRVQPIAFDDMLYVFGNGGEIAAYKLEAKK
ncbi:MAG: outer membrane protein assembly factor BamB [Spongiibacteraceae bacterium]